MKYYSFFFFFLLLTPASGQNHNLEKAGAYLYTKQDSAYYYLNLAEQAARANKDHTATLEVYTFFNEASIVHRNLTQLKKTLDKQTSLINDLGNNIETILDGGYYKVYYWFDMGRYFYIINDYEKAIPFFYNILNEIEKKPDKEVLNDYSVFLTSSNSYLATIFRNQLKYEVANEFYNENLRLHEKFNHDKESVYDTKNLIASLLSAQKNFPVSNQYAKESIEYYVKEDPEYFDTSLLSTSALLVNNYIKMQELDSAKIYLDRTLPYLSPNTRFESDFLFLKSKLAVLQHKYNDALEIYFKALNKLKKENTNGDEIAFILKEIADVYAILNEPENALKFYNEGLKLFPSEKDNSVPNDNLKAKNKINILPILRNSSNTFLNLKTANGFESAIDKGSATVKTLKYLKTSFYSDSDKQVLIDNVLPIFESSIEGCYQQFQKTGNVKYIDTAFAFFEHSKSPILLDALSKNNATRFAGVPDSLLQQERILKISIANLEKEIQLSDNNRQSELFALKRAHEKLISSLEKNHPTYYELKYETQTISFDELQENLSDSDVVLSYFVGKNYIYTLTLANNEKRLQKFDYTEKDIELFISLQKQLANARSDLKKLNQDSFTIYSKFVVRSIEGLDFRNLLILPDGLLRTIPFGALNTKENKPTYLINKLNITYCYSANLLSKLKSRRKNKPSLLAFAPDFEASDDFLPLPNNINEVKSITQYFKNKTYIGKNATIKNFNEELKNHNIIHLATHAITNDNIPEYSHLAFSNKGEDDFLIYVNDLYNIQLNADLVTLSACETGVGQLLKGEGAISLARAFFYSGAKSLVNSLWNIDDRSSSEIMGGFYKKLAEGKSKNIALQEAKLDFLVKNKETALVHPYYWSSFIVQGNTLPLVSRSNWLVYLSTIILLFLLVFLFRKKLAKLFK